MKQNLTRYYKHVSKIFHENYSMLKIKIGMLKKFYKAGGTGFVCLKRGNFSMGDTS